MPAAMNRDQFDLHFGAVAPEDSLDPDAVGCLRFVCSRLTGDMIEVRKILT